MVSPVRRCMLGVAVRILWGVRVRSIGAHGLRLRSL